MEQNIETKVLQFSQETNTTINFAVEEKKEEEIKQTITTDVKQEEEIKKQKEEAEKKAQEEAQKKAEQEAKEKAEKTIYLSDGVTYNHSMESYCCEGCITNALIKTFKNAKGYLVKSADSNRIDLVKITGLSGKYNSTKYYGSGLTNKLTSAGAELCGGAGGSQDPLTKKVCTDHHLICE